jgi:hypothetical protein
LRRHAAVEAAIFEATYGFLTAALRSHVAYDEHLTVGCEIGIGVHAVRALRENVAGVIDAVGHYLSGRNQPTVETFEQMRCQRGYRRRWPAPLNKTFGMINPVSCHQE